jgi:RNA polymerase sigma-70 factor, ECF subfamily
MPESNHTDEELVALSLSDKDAFAHLVYRYAPKLRTYIARISGLGSEDIEDILQDSFVRIYEHLNDFDPLLSFSSWAYRITHNQTMTFFRKRKARPEGHLKLLSDEELTSFSASTDVFADSAATYDASKLREVLTTLTKEYYDVLVLRYFEHKSYDEISDILSLAPGTVAVRLSRAKAKIKKTMEANGYHYA